MGANDIQIGGEHYKTGDVEHWDWAADMPYLEARCTAYIARHQDKKGMQDIEKALHFIQKILERRYGATLTWEIETTPFEEEYPSDLIQLPREYVNPDL